MALAQGDVETACFHIIEKGEVSVLIENGTREVNKLGEGDFFGEVTLLGELQVLAPTLPPIPCFVPAIHFQAGARRRACEKTRVLYVVSVG